MVGGVGSPAYIKYICGENSAETLAGARTRRADTHGLFSWIFNAFGMGFSAGPGHPGQSEGGRDSTAGVREQGPVHACARLVLAVPAHTKQRVPDSLGLWGRSHAHRAAVGGQHAVDRSRTCH